MEKLHARGRPLGNKRRQLSSWVTGNGQFTMGQMARSLGWPIDQADVTLRRAVAAREVERVGSMRTDNAKRPVAVYQAHGVEVQQGPSLADAVLTWGRT